MINWQFYFEVFLFIFICLIPGIFVFIKDKLYKKWRAEDEELGWQMRSRPGHYKLAQMIDQREKVLGKLKFVRDHLTADEFTKKNWLYVILGAGGAVIGTAIAIAVFVSIALTSIEERVRYNNWNEIYNTYTFLDSPTHLECEKAEKENYEISHMYTIKKESTDDKARIDTDRLWVKFYSRVGNDYSNKTRSN